MLTGRWPHGLSSRNWVQTVVDGSFYSTAPSVYRLIPGPCCLSFLRLLLSFQSMEAASAAECWVLVTAGNRQTHADSCRLRGECRQQCCTNACTGWMFNVCPALAPGISDVSVPLSSLNITICQYIRSEIVIWSQLTGDPASVDALNFWE